MITRPMLAAKIESQEQLMKLHFPVLATPKIDGIRAVTVDGKLRTRKLKLIPNLHVSHYCSSIGIDGLDGELMLSGWPIPSFNKVASAIMSREGMPDFVWYLFDFKQTGTSFTYLHRVEQLMEMQFKLPQCCKVLIPRLCSNLDELVIFEDECVSAGWEGVCFRTPNSPYKCGRSTLREQWLVKWKRYLDDEAIVTGFVELQHNENEATLDELGYTKRSSEQAGQTPGNMLGSLITDWKGLELKIGSGFTEAERVEIWENREKYIGKEVTFRYVPHGLVELPRHPIFKGWRKD